MVRALEQSVPLERRIIEDPFAKEFLLNRRYQWLASNPLLARGLLLFMKYWAPGGQEFLTVRPRLVDDLAVKLSSEGLDQIVILGAGFDTMVLRIHESLANVIVFEVDHPATQSIKRKTMQRLGQPENLRFVAVDFEKGDFRQKLIEAGFDTKRHSFLIWVGVSYYLTERAVANTMEQLARLGNAGTTLVWDYLLAEVVNGATTNRNALSKARKAERLGEPWLFGLEISQVAAFVEQFGFRPVKDYSPEELQRLYCPHRATPMSYVRIVVCEKQM